MTSYKFEGWVGRDKKAADGHMEWGSFEPKKWEESDVDIQVTHCGVCATDLHTLRADFGPTPYREFRQHSILREQLSSNCAPEACVVGHELVGKAVRVGTDVNNIKVGDRVGVGPQARSCERADCYECSSNQSNYCPRAVATYGAVYPDDIGKSYGGYSNYTRVHNSFVFKIPDGIASEDAASMFCAGVTMYVPLKKYGCGPAKKVGIVGLGGLGHYGILFAKALKAQLIVAISRRRFKAQDSLDLGADKYIATMDDDDWQRQNYGSLDIIMVTASSPDMNMDQYLDMLRPGGVLIQVGFVPLVIFY